jgi:hypothetical protein
MVFVLLILLRASMMTTGIPGMVYLKLKGSLITKGNKIKGSAHSVGRQEWVLLGGQA